jgi:hypothetical protein
MPTPRKGEPRDEFMDRCIPFVIKREGKTVKQAAGMCGGIYDHQKGRKRRRKK